jgi:oxygen-independent coproporphyrinogen III oxidase
MAGVYIHVPFCRKACHYCDFHFSTQSGYVGEMAATIRREIVMRAGYLQGQSVSTIYFGGGTPSVFAVDEIKRILEEVYRNVDVLPDPEITLEANPDDLSASYIRELLESGVNRLSVGIQSFHDDELKALHRTHSASQAESAVKRAQDTGLENITIDLMYALPGTTSQRWEHSLQSAVNLNVPHISAYCLTIESGTYFGHLYRKRPEVFSEDSVAEQQYSRLCEVLHESGYMHYEVSNFARPGMESRHNSAYWNGVHYLGIGPSAHSFDGASRQWNVSNNHLYMKSVAAGSGYFEREELSEADRFNELLITRLRTHRGLERNVIFQNKSDQYIEAAASLLGNWQSRGLLDVREDVLVLTEPGLLIADQLITQLMIE